MREKVVVITGAASGIGYHMGISFLNEGAQVVFSDIDAQKVDDVTKQLKQEGYRCIGVHCDVTNEHQIEQLIKQTIVTYGRIDVLVNNAGYQHIDTIEEFPAETFSHMLQVMVTGAFITTKNVFPIMKQQQFGRIINMSSINGVVGFAGKSAYNSAKHGLIGLTKVAALEGATDGITVNAICPGYVDTPLVRNQLEDLATSRNVPLETVLEDVLYPLVPQKRLLDVEEIADYALFLASEKARGVTGQAVLLDGGYSAQ